jgi:hypothetical protein
MINKCRNPNANNQQVVKIRKKRKNIIDIKDEKKKIRQKLNENIDQKVKLLFFSSQVRSIVYS